MPLDQLPDLYVEHNSAATTFPAPLFDYLKQAEGIYDTRSTDGLRVRIFYDRAPQGLTGRLMTVESFADWDDESITHHAVLVEDESMGISGCGDGSDVKGLRSIEIFDDGQFRPVYQKNFRSS
jgi:hypothetical protein